MREPLVAIVLLNWNGWRETIECLESIFRLDYPSWSVIVCDNASTDDSLNRIRQWASGRESVRYSGPQELRHLVEPPARKPIALTEISVAETERHDGSLPERALVIIRNDQNAGYAAGNNVGARYARRLGARYVWILNNDTVVAPDSLSKLIACAESTPNVGAVGATIFEYHAPREIQFAAGGDFGPWHSFGIYRKRVGTRSSPSGSPEADVDFITGCSLLLSGDAIDRVGPIAEQFFMYGEDVDYSLRIRRAGMKLLYAAQAQVWHQGGASMEHRSARHDYYAIRNALHLVAKYHPRMIPVTMLYLAYRVVLPKIARGEWSRLSVVRRAYRDYATGVFGKAVTDVPPVLT
jgi:GT2 family glycosyltransferase